MKNLLLALTVLLSLQSINLSAQSSAPRMITGRVVDDTNEPLLFASVFAVHSNVGTLTDFEGNFKLEVMFLHETLKVMYIGYETITIDILDSDSVVVIMKAGVLLNEAIVTAYSVPLIDADNTTSGSVKTAEQIRNLPVKSITTIAATTAGTSSIDGNDINVRGSRKKATNYYIDGVQTNSSGQNLPVFHDEAEETFNTENYGVIKENTFHTPADEPMSTFSIDVDAASYSNMRRFLSNGQMPPKDAIRIEELVNYFDYEYSQPADDVPFSITAEAGQCPWNEEHKLVHIGLQGKSLATEDLPASNLVFLIDVSGSMDSPDKLPLVISSFIILVENLREKDRIAIVVYAGNSGLVLPSTSGSDKAKILGALERLEAGGSTAGAAGIKLAYEIARKHFITGGNNRVILATDGDFNVGVSSESELVTLIEKEKESGVFLTVLGFGTGNYQDDKMQQLADHGNGNHGYVDNIMEARKVFVHEFGGTLFAIAKDVKIQVEFNPALVAGYRLIGYENRMLEKEDFNDDKKDAGEIGSGHSVTAVYEIIPAGIKSSFLKSVDELKYKKLRKALPEYTSDELMTVKFRYKNPDGDTSKLIQKVVMNAATTFNATSENFRWSSSVALFGMLLRKSEFAGNSTFKDVEKWASGSIGKDEFGYRKEFLQLVEGVQTVAGISVEK